MGCQVGGVFSSAELACSIFNFLFFLLLLIDCHLSEKSRELSTFSVFIFTLRDTFFIQRNFIQQVFVFNLLNHFVGCDS